MLYICPLLMLFLQAFMNSSQKENVGQDKPFRPLLWHQLKLFLCSHFTMDLSGKLGAHRKGKTTEQCCRSGIKESEWPTGQSTQDCGLINRSKRHRQRYRVCKKDPGEDREKQIQFLWCSKYVQNSTSAFYSPHHRSTARVTTCPYYYTVVWVHTDGRGLYH